MVEQALVRPDIVVLDDEDAIAREAAARLIEALGAAIAERGEAHLALTGGSSAIALYRELREPGYATAVDWRRVHLWWGDERLVPVDHPESNIGLAYNLLLEMAARAGESGSGGEGADVESGDLPALPIRVENVHPFAVDEVFSESEPGQLVAQRYAEEIERFLPEGGDLPAFDVVLLGVGPDGHILSIFPGSTAIASSDLVVSVPAPQDVEPHIERVSIHPRLLQASALNLVMVSGTAKADVLRKVLEGPRDATELPAQFALLPHTVWILDRAAAAGLTGDGGKEAGT